MNTDDLTTTAITTALAFALGGLLAGMLARLLMLRQSGNGATPRERLPKQIVLEAIARAAPVCIFAAGLYAASIALPLRPRIQAIVSSVLVAASIFAGTLAAARLTQGFVAHYSARHERLPGASSIFGNIARVVVMALGLLVALQTLGVSVGPLITAMGVGGLAVALALQDTLSNLFAGLHVIASRKVVPGDYVRLDSGEEGYVADINWRNTSLLSLASNTILVPNARLASAVVTNFYQPASEMSVIVQVGVGYSTDLQRAERITRAVGAEVLREVEGGVGDFEPLIRYHTFADSSINFDVILRVGEPADQYLIKHEFVKRLHERYKVAGIEIPFPTQTVISGDEDRADSEAVRARSGQ